METQKQETTQEYSNIKVSKETAKIFNALAKWSEFFSSLEGIDSISDIDFEIDFHNPMYEIRDMLDAYLIDSIIQHQNGVGPYTFKVI